MVDCVVEAVLSGGSMRVTLLPTGTISLLVNLAGVQCPSMGRRVRGGVGVSEWECKAGQDGAWVAGSQGGMWSANGDVGDRVCGQLVSGGWGRRGCDEQAGAAGRTDMSVYGRTAGGWRPGCS